MPIGATLRAMLDKLPADKRAKMEAALTEVDEITTEIEQGVLRQSDYTRKTQELAREREDLSRRWDEANTEYQRMLSENANMQASLTSTQAEKDEAARKLAEAQQKLQSTSTIDPAKYLTAEQVEERMRKFVAGNLSYYVNTQHIAQEHAKLFGQPLDLRDLAQKAAEANKSPEDYWSETFKVADKRKEIADAAHAAELEKARNEGYQRRIAEEANPATRPMRESQNPFYTPKEDPAAKADPWDNSVELPSDTAMREALEKQFG